MLVPERFHNTSVTVLDAERPYTARTLNCVAHLDGREAAARLGGAV
jgi:hypothetical protein